MIKNGQMRRKNYTVGLLVTLLCLQLLALPMRAQVNVEATIDSVQLLIGQQSKLKLTVNCDANQQLKMPELKDAIQEGIEIVGDVKTDTQYINGKDRMTVTQEYLVTSFDTSFYYINPFEVLVDSQKYYSNSLALKVLTFDIDTTEVNAIFDIKGIRKAPLLFSEYWPLIAVVVLLALVVILIVYLFDRYRSNKPILRRVSVKPKLPAHEQALNDMARIKDEKGWMKEDTKQYYTELTDVLRTYIEDRFGFNAKEMTSSEIIEHLLEQKDEESIRELKELFMTSDLVKFAKFKPLINENDMNLINAIDFVNETKLEVTEPAEPTTEIVVVKEGRSHKAKVLLISAIVLLALSGVALIWWGTSVAISLFF